MKSLTFNRNTAKGFSLIELLLVLGVLAILLVAAFVVYPQVRDRNQANAEVSNLTTIKANINNLYASRGGNYEDLSNVIAINARAYPPNMVSGTTANSAWGSPVNVAANAAATAGMQPNRSFTITYNAVPEGVCLGMVSGAAGNFADITIDNNSVIQGDDGDGTQFDPGAAAAACASDGTRNIAFISN